MILFDCYFKLINNLNCVIWNLLIYFIYASCMIQITNSWIPTILSSRSCSISTPKMSSITTSLAIKINSSIQMHHLLTIHKSWTKLFSTQEKKLHNKSIKKVTKSLSTNQAYHLTNNKIKFVSKILKEKRRPIKPIKVIYRATKL